MVMITLFEFYRVMFPSHKEFSDHYNSEGKQIGCRFYRGIDKEKVMEFVEELKANGITRDKISVFSPNKYDDDHSF